MPIYEYVCDVCRHEFEELARSMSDSPSPACPACDSVEVARKLSVFAAPQADANGGARAVGPCGRCGDPNGPCSM